MADQTLAIEDFRHGLDVRKSPLTAVGGSLQIMDNCVLNNGGEIEKRQAFVPLFQLPVQCLGLFGTSTGLHTFGNAAPPTMPTGAAVPVIYHQLQNAPAPIARILDIETYKGDFYVTAQLQNGALANWWAGVYLTNAPAGDYVRVYQTKTYRTQGQYLRFSSVDNPAVDIDDPTTSNVGGGFVDLASNDTDTENVSGLEVYYDALAIFARRTTQIYNIDPDPSLNALKQVLRIGTLAGKSVRQFGTGDVLFLSDSGIRSLRALNITLAAGVIDVGSPIDTLITALVNADPAAAQYAQAVVQPVTGRYLLAIGGTVYVLSFYPSAKISAWSTWTLPFAVTQWAVVGNQIYAMDTNRNVYLYGGLDGMTYDSCLVRVRTPHLSEGRPNVEKKVTALSAVVQGTWQINLGALADNVAAFEPIATTTGPTITQQRIPAAARGTHIAVELVSQAPGPALLSSIAIDYKTNEKL